MAFDELSIGEVALILIADACEDAWGVVMKRKKECFVKWVGNELQEFFQYSGIGLNWPVNMKLMEHVTFGKFAFLAISRGK